MFNESGEVLYCGLCTKERARVGYWVKRVARAVAGRVRRAFSKRSKTPANVTTYAIPPFYCHTCQRFIPEKNVEQVAPKVDNGFFIGITVKVSCHGETEEKQVSLPGMMIRACHWPAFFPRRRRG